MPSDISRRNVIRSGVAALTALSYSRVLGANDRIQIGQIGCGNRAVGLRRMLKAASKSAPKFDFRSVCDLWSVNREKGAEHVASLFGAQPKQYQYSEDLLADRDLDAVIVSTGDHQHARILAEVVRAGKDCYCEKPMANTLDDAKLARDAVRETGRVLQMGSQWLSDPYQHRVREIIRNGEIGKVVSISQSWNYNGPRWHDPKEANVAAIREQDTDWKRWLLGRKDRPFDPRAYFEFRIFKDFSGGITDQWYSHGSGLAHFYLDTFIPDDTVANGGIFAWHDVRQNPDTFQCISTFQEKEVLYSYSTTFGNAYGDHTIIRGTRERSFRPAAKAARSGGGCPNPRAAGAPTRSSTCTWARSNPSPSPSPASRASRPLASPTTSRTTPTTGSNASSAAASPTATSTPATPTPSPWSWPPAATAKARRCAGTGRRKRSSRSLHSDVLENEELQPVSRTNAFELKVTASSDSEVQLLVDTIVGAATDLGAEVVVEPPARTNRKHIVELGEVATLLIQGTASVGLGLITSAIYDRVKSASRAPNRISKRETETDVEITDPTTGAQIRVRWKRSETWEPDRP